MDRDRLKNIKRKLSGDWKHAKWDDSPRDDIEWLVAQVDALQEELDNANERISALECQDWLDAQDLDEEGHDGP